MHGCGWKGRSIRWVWRLVRSGCGVGSLGLVMFGCISTAIVEQCLKEVNGIGENASLCGARAPLSIMYRTSYMMLRKMQWLCKVVYTACAGTLWPSDTSESISSRYLEL